MNEEERPACRFGAKCYRKNALHFKKYSHPGNIENLNDDSLPPSKKRKFEKDNLKLSETEKKIKQTTLNFVKNSDCANSHTQRKMKKMIVGINNDSKETPSTSRIKKKKDDLKTNNEDVKNSSFQTVQSTNKFNIDDKNIVADMKTTENHKTCSSDENIVENSPEDIIRSLYLVNMPQDFYSFFEFCKTIDSNQPLKSLQQYGLNLVGPFEVLAGDKKYVTKRGNLLCHWRFFYDPPEFQTVLASDSEFHMGYWRDDPKSDPVFVASNDPSKNCIFKVEAENLFGSVFHYLKDATSSCDPFKKTDILKLNTRLTQWAEKHKFTLDKRTSKITARQKKVVAKTFHKLGIVVPIESKTEVGYRPLIETEANLRKMCKLIMEATDKNERDSLWENLQPLINAANIANDECDFGNSLELGMNLFCMGSPLFDTTVELLLTTAYSLLDRTEFEDIIKAHLKNRRRNISINV